MEVPELFQMSDLVMGEILGCFLYAVRLSLLWLFVGMYIGSRLAKICEWIKLLLC